MKAIAGEEYLKDFDREAKLLSCMNHLNIVTFFGACIDESPRKLVFEYMANGDLNHFLRYKLK